MEIKHMKAIKQISFILFAMLTLGSCEDIIKVDVTQSQVKLVIDAFVNNLDTVQKIRLTKSINYFDSSNTEPPVTDATVIVADSATLKIFPFIYTSNGNYEWKPNKNTGDTFTIGHTYALLVITKEDTLLSFSHMNPTIVKFDSIRTVPTEGNGPPQKKPGKFVELFAKDLTGPGNYYWIKTFRNDSFINEVRRLNISQDMGNGSPQQDGGLFIYPKRFSGLNQFDRPYFDGDKVRIEVHSINQLCYFWLSLVANENRNSGLFATPPVNIPNYCFYSVSFTDPSNPFSFKIKDPKNPPPVGGFFCVSEVRTAEIGIKM